jgi:Alpha/beta hydrolase domain containing 18
MAILNTIQGFNILSLIDRSLVSLDEAYFAFRKKTKSGRLQLFHQGWGDQNAVDYVGQNWMHEGNPSPANICWETPEKLCDGVTISRGTFTSKKYQRWMEEGCSNVNVVFIRPESGRAKKGVFIAPTSREKGFKRRLVLARKLARMGVGCMLIDNPFMGERKPRYQIDTVICRLSDYPLMIAACIEENRSILQWMNDYGMEKICATGVSQGGFTSAVAALRVDFPVGVVAVVPPNGVEDILRHGIPGRMLDWEALKSTCPSKSNPIDDMKEIFSFTRLDVIDVPRNGTSVKLIAAKRDKFITQNSYQQLEEHWKDFGNCQWNNCGHVASILDRKSHIKEIIKALSL